MSLLDSTHKMQYAEFGLEDLNALIKNIVQGLFVVHDKVIVSLKKLTKNQMYGDYVENGIIAGTTTAENILNRESRPDVTYFLRFPCFAKDRTGKHKIHHCGLLRVVREENVVHVHFYDPQNWRGRRPHDIRHLQPHFFRGIFEILRKRYRRSTIKVHWIHGNQVGPTCAYTTLKQLEYMARGLPMDHKKSDSGEFEL